MDKQKTIAKEFRLSGVGLHTGKKVDLVFKPAEIDAGINFIRVDLDGKPVIKACVENSITKEGSLRRSSIGKDGVEIFTVEHLMSALVGAGIDNLTIEIDQDEAPGFDGSSLEFYKAFISTGMVEQDKDRQAFVIREPLVVESEASTLMVLPSEEFKISYTLEYNHPFIKTDFLSLVISSETYQAELAGARTFVLEEEADALQKAGFGQGADYSNTLVVGANGVIKNKLRFENEFVRHKISDLLGDLYLLGAPLKAHVVAIRSGHSLNLKLIKKIAQQKEKQFLGGISINHQPQANQVLEAEMIMKILPHRDPFLFVDRVTELDPGKRAVGIKNVTINDYFFKGHFPGRPVMPGVLMLEAMAQVGGVMMLSAEENRGKLAFFMAISNVKFRKTVVPGDQLVFEVIAGKIKSKTGIVFGKALVEGKVVAEAELMFALAER